MKGDRLECKRCQVLFNETNGDRCCWMCGDPATPAFQLYIPMNPWTGIAVPNQEPSP